MAEGRAPAGRGGASPKLFGGWEGNWVAFNTAHDVALPSATQGGKLGFFMYPQAETCRADATASIPTFKYRSPRE